jgi:hypothetical protein
MLVFCDLVNDSPLDSLLLLMISVDTSLALAALCVNMAEAQEACFVVRGSSSCYVLWPIGEKK